MMMVLVRFVRPLLMQATVTLSCSILARRLIALTSGELLINKNITVIGPGPDLLTVKRAPDASNFRIFHIAPAHTATLEGLTITNGYTNFGFVSGGGIYSDRANVTINRCVVTDNSFRNQGGFSGGGVGNYADHTGNASVTINDSVVSNNNVKDGVTANIGGGILNFALQGTAMLTVNNSTISGNQAFQGGAIFNNGGVSGSVAVVTINNCAFSGNIADQNAGGIVNLGDEGGVATVTVRNSTFAGNFACSTCNFYGGAIFNDGNGQPGGATAEIGNTIFKGDIAIQRNVFNHGGIVVSDGYNLTNDAGVLNSLNGSGGFTVVGDVINTDPLLGPLQDNGGLTPSHELLLGSPAIDTGDPAFTRPPFFDQRGQGFDRIVNGQIDRGSFEVQGPGPTPTSTPTDTPTPGIVIVTVDTSPVGRAFTVDGVPYGSAQQFQWQIGSIHQVSTTSPQNIDADTRYVWDSWSDGGTITHDVTATADTSLCGLLY